MTLNDKSRAIVGGAARRSTVSEHIRQMSFSIAVSTERSFRRIRAVTASHPTVLSVLCVCLAVAGSAPGEVVGRYVFYNNSAFDNDDPGVNSYDDAAIAPDKEPLLAGQTATFANYTSYSRGINGIAIDVKRLNGEPTLSDFEFRGGNDNDPSNWAVAPAAQVSIRAGAGAGGCDRVVLTWADNSIANQWLQVRLLATSVTGLSSPDIFYFGNSIGDCGNNQADAWVTPTDALVLINYLNSNGSHAVDIGFDYDHNRDGWISTIDVLIVNDSINGGYASTLNLITAPAPSGTTTLPTDCDAWTEYLTGVLAQEDGWHNTCGLSQEIVASGECVGGLHSVGCRATQNIWDKPFQFDKFADISQASELRFQHKDSWSGRGVQLRIYMEPTAVERALGMVEKKVVFDYYTALSWTLFSGVLRDGAWSWKDENENWFTLTSVTEPTTLIRIEWFHIAFPWITPVVIADEMLIDGMHFVMTAPGSSFGLADLAAFAGHWLRDDCGQVNDSCEGADANANGRVDFADYAVLLPD